MPSIPSSGASTLSSARVSAEERLAQDLTSFLGSKAEGADKLHLKARKRTDGEFDLRASKNKSGWIAKKLSGKPRQSANRMRSILADKIQSSGVSTPLKETLISMIASRSGEKPSPALLKQMAAHIRDMAGVPVNQPRAEGYGETLKMDDELGQDLRDSLSSVFTITRANRKGVTEAAGSGRSTEGEAASGEKGKKAKKGKGGGTSQAEGGTGGQEAQRSGGSGRAGTERAGTERTGSMRLVEARLRDIVASYASRLPPHALAFASKEELQSLIEELGDEVGLFADKSKYGNAEDLAEVRSILRDAVMDAATAQMDFHCDSVGAPKLTDAEGRSYDLQGEGRMGPEVTTYHYRHTDASGAHRDIDVHVPKAGTGRDWAANSLQAGLRLKENGGAMTHIQPQEGALWIGDSDRMAVVTPHSEGRGPLGRTVGQVGALLRDGLATPEAAKHFIDTCLAGIETGLQEIQDAGMSVLDLDISQLRVAPNGEIDLPLHALKLGQARPSLHDLREAGRGDNLGKLAGKIAELFSGPQTLPEGRLEGFGKALFPEAMIADKLDLDLLKENYWPSAERVVGAVTTAAERHAVQSRLAEARVDGAEVHQGLMEDLRQRVGQVLDLALLARTGNPRPPAQPAGPQPAAGQPAGPQPAAGQPAGPQPAAGQPAGPQPAAGQPAGPQPAAGQPAAPQPAAGQPAVPHPAAGQPAVPQPAAGQAEAPQPVGDGNAAPGTAAQVIHDFLQRHIEQRGQAAQPNQAGQDDPLRTDNALQGEGAQQVASEQTLDQRSVTDVTIEFSGLEHQSMTLVAAHEMGQSDRPAIAALHQSVDGFLAGLRAPDAPQDPEVEALRNDARALRSDLEAVLAEIDGANNDTALQGAQERQILARVETLTTDFLGVVDAMREDPATRLPAETPAMLGTARAAHDLLQDVRNHRGSALQDVDCEGRLQDVQVAALTLAGRGLAEQAGEHASVAMGPLLETTFAALQTGDEAPGRPQLELKDHAELLTDLLVRREKALSGAGGAAVTSRNVLDVLKIGVKLAQEERPADPETGIVARVLSDDEQDALLMRQVLGVDMLNDVLREELPADFNWTQPLASLPQMSEAQQAQLSALAPDEMAARDAVLEMMRDADGAQANLPNQLASATTDAEREMLRRSVYADWDQAASGAGDALGDCLALSDPEGQLAPVIGDLRLQQAIANAMLGEALIAWIGGAGSPAMSEEDDTSASSTSGSRTSSETETSSEETVQTSGARQPKRAETPEAPQPGLAERAKTLMADADRLHSEIVDFEAQIIGPPQVPGSREAYDRLSKIKSMGWKFEEWNAQAREALYDVEVLLRDGALDRVDRLNLDGTANRLCTAIVRSAVLGGGGYYFGVSDRDDGQPLQETMDRVNKLGAVGHLQKYGAYPGTDAEWQYHTHGKVPEGTVHLNNLVPQKIRATESKGNTPKGTSRSERPVETSGLTSHGTTNADDSANAGSEDDGSINDSDSSSAETVQSTGTGQANAASEEEESNTDSSSGIGSGTNSTEDSSDTSFRSSSDTSASRSSGSSASRSAEESSSSSSEADWGDDFEEAMELIQDQRRRMEQHEAGAVPDLLTVESLRHMANGARRRIAEMEQLERQQLQGRPEKVEIAEALVEMRSHLDRIGRLMEGDLAQNARVMHLLSQVNGGDPLRQFDVLPPKDAPPPLPGQAGTPPAASTTDDRTEGAPLNFRQAMDQAGDLLKRQQDAIEAATGGALDYKQMIDDAEKRVADLTALEASGTLSLQERLQDVRTVIQLNHHINQLKELGQIDQPNRQAGGAEQTTVGGQGVEDSVSEAWNTSGQGDDDASGGGIDMDAMRARLGQMFDGAV